MHDDRDDALSLKLTHIFKKTSRQRRQRAASAFHHKAIVLPLLFPPYVR